MVLPSEVAEQIEPEPGDVYHYTDANGLLNIVQSNELWATESHGMNDVAEIKQGWIVIRDWLRRQNANDPTVSDFQSAAGSGSDDYGYTYFCCASTMPDDANQWRNYAAGGRGFAIALGRETTYRVVTASAPPQPPADPDSLGRRVAGWTEYLDSYESTSWLKVLYTRQEKESILDAYLASARAGRDEALDPAKFKVESDWSVARADLLGEYRADLEALARLMKGEGFKGESEVRLVVSTAGSRYAGIRAGQYGITMYQRLAPADSSGAEPSPFLAPAYGVAAGQSGGRLPIEQVWCGPLVNAETNKHAIAALLSRGGHRNVPVIGSSVSLR